MKLDKDKIAFFTELAELVISFGIKVSETMKKHNVKEEDIQALREAIKKNPEDYFPSLNK